MGLHFDNATYSSKNASPAAQGMIELDFTDAVSDCASALIKVMTTGCFVIEDMMIEICLPHETIGTSESPFSTLSEYLAAVLNQHWGIGGFTDWEPVGASTPTKGRVKWQSTTEGLYPSFSIIPQGYKSFTDNLIKGTAVNDNVTKLECGKYHCGYPVGTMGCSDSVYNYTETTAETLRFVGVVQADLCGGCACDCSPTCKCPPVRVLTSGTTPLKFDPNVQIDPKATLLTWDVEAQVYGLLTEAEYEAADPTKIALLRRNAQLVQCCATQKNLKAIKF